MSDIDVIKQVAALPGMATPELKALWTKYNETEPPPFNRTFLVKRLAYRIQELAYGGLSEETEKRLEEMSADNGEATPAKANREQQILPGTRLVREYKGKEYVCTVLEDGFEYQGRRFKSLTGVANFITGTRWNGYIFFGLKKYVDPRRKS
ncbi:MAG: DUF2924 domain-containing protein [Magnetococcales bacterium]|nr:DUF2924 domain-containing protein [Magnetococcales bacterium]